ncbi:MAG: hypothetical protein AAGB34_05445, partial [Planctomycetota bacterium]
MRVRTQLLLLLLVMTLIPLLVLAAIGQAGTRSLGSKIENEATREINNEAKVLLSRFASEAADRFRRETEVLESAMLLQKTAAERFLYVAEIPEERRRPILFADELRQRRELPEG